jgi:hypothetical protein
LCQLLQAKSRKITESTAVEQNVFNGTTKTNPNSGNFFMEEKVSAVMKNLKAKARMDRITFPLKY